ncbi:hypothetical protein BGZ54_006628 [Gamsiella multidivaricata]|nr:hypothetical protein BGZ54_006628 [Gamsiella multidivaricata]
MSNHAKKEASAKNSSSLANLRNVIASQTEAAPRKTISHEGFQKTTQASNLSPNTEGAPTASNPSSSINPIPTNGNSTNSISNSGSSGGVSTFSYLKARFFGSVADASTSLTTSARDLLQTKKGSDPAKGSAIPEPSLGGISMTAAANRGRHDGNRNHSKNSDNAHAMEAGAAATIDTSAPSTNPLLSPAAAQHLSSTHRFLSRTLPSRRHAQLEPLQFSLEKQDVPISPTNLPPLSTSEDVSAVFTSSPSSLHVPSSSTTSQQVDRAQRRPVSAMSKSSTQKHTSTGSLIYQEGYLNKKAESHSGETGHGWKVYKVVLKSSKLYFYKPLAADDRPRFQDPNDHNRHHPSPNYLPQGYHHSQQSSSSGIISPRLSITNECGMVLSAFNFESSTRTLLFEGNAKSLSQGTQAFAPPVTKYVYGECFTEIDRLTMQLKKHVALLLFEDSVVICKRKWIRYTSTKVKDAIKFSSNAHDKGDHQESISGKRQGSISGISHKSSDSRGSEGEQRSWGSLENSSEKQRGYFTKWKHEATFPLSQIEALDMASPVPSSSATFYPFAAPATVATGNVLSNGRNPRDSDLFSISTATSIPSHTHQTTSTLELVITSIIDGMEYTHRLLYLPPSQEVRHQWYSKFNRVKELYQPLSRATSKGRGSAESLVLKDTLSPHSVHSNHSTMSLHSPTSQRSFSEAGDFVLKIQKMERARAFYKTSRHPDLIFNTDEKSGKIRLTGASINGLIHELVYDNMGAANLDLVFMFATTYPLFTTITYALRELRRCICLQQLTITTNNKERMVQRVEVLIQEMVRRLNPTDPAALEEIRVFTENILREKLDSTAVTDILTSIKSILQRCDDSIENSQEGTGTPPSTQPVEIPVDLSNVLITGLTPAVFLKLDAAYIAQQVLRYHQEQLQLTGGFSALLYNPSFFMRQYPTAGAGRQLQSSLIFSMYSPHFLTVLITHHILIATQSVQSTSRRPKLLAQWIRTAQYSRTLGDMVGFMAIAAGVCSPGVVRLQETWKHVPLDLRLEVVQTWVPLLIKTDMVTEELQELAVSSFNLKPFLHTVVDLSLEGKGAVVPCACNIKQSIDQLDRVMPSFIQPEPVPLLNIEKLEHIHSILHKATQSLTESSFSAKATVSSLESGHLQQYFGHLASISQTLHNQYHSNELSNDAFESSLACEPHFCGQYLDYHYKNRKMTGSFMPLIFPEVAPERRLFPLPLLLTLENTGNTNRKSSFDEEQSAQLKSMSGTNLTNQTTGLASTIGYGSAESMDSAATHHGSTNLDLAGSAVYMKPRKRTYSFPPARARGRSRGGDASQPMVNMINPHLDAVACGCLLSGNGNESDEVFVAMRNVTCIGYQAILLEDGDLMLKVKEENLETLVKAAVLEEEADLAADLQKSSGRWSAGSIHGSNRNSLSVISGPRPALVKAGTLDALIRVAVMGLEDQGGKYMDEKGDMIAWANQPLALDHESFMKAFFATYSSFCTASRLLDQLVVMFTFEEETGSRASTIPSGLDLFSAPRHASLTISTRTIVGSRGSSTFDWKMILAIQSNVLRALELWLTAHISDFLDDLSLKVKLSKVLKQMSMHEESQSTLIGEAHSVETQALRERLREVERLAVQQSMQPLDAVILGSGTLETFFGTPPSMAPQMDETWTADQILDQLNMAAWAHFLSVREQEWFVLFEVLESQSADPLGWYLPRFGSTPPDEDTIITGIHNTLYSIQRNGAPGTHWNGERLMNSLPMCLQNLCKLHHVIRGWVVSQIAAPSISYDTRLDRMQKMLDVIMESRRAMTGFGEDHIKSSTTTPLDPGTTSAAGVPSFVENAVVSALISPESRAFTRVWIKLAADRKGSVETLEDVLTIRRERESTAALSTISDQPITTSQELVPAVGWLIERLLETCCYVRDMCYESPMLVNFDKRQYVYDLIQIYTRRQEQLRSIQKVSTPLSSWLGLSTGPSSNLPMKLVRESAQREATSQRGGSNGQLSNATNLSGRSSRPIKIFSRLVALQHEKVKRDQKEYEKLEKQIKDTQGRIQKAQQEQAKNLEKQIKLEQSRSRVKNQLLKSTLMRAMRPISLAITNSWSSATTTVSNATAIGSAISGKVMGGTAAGDAADALGVAHQRSIQPQPRIVSRTGSIYSLSNPKSVLVINLINSTCSVAYTYTKRDFVFKIITEEGVFGVELRHLMSEGNVPLIVEKCITEIEKRGSENVDLDSDEWKDINVVAGALKQFLRELPEAVMTSALYDSLIAASALEDYDERLLTMKDLIRALPTPNYILLKRVIEHLERVTDFEEVNHMYATNLAIVFGPTLLRPGGNSANSFATSMKNLGHQQNIVRNLILQYHWLFDVEDEEGTGEVEDEEDEEEGGLGEFPEILEDSDEGDYEGDDDDDDVGKVGDTETEVQKSKDEDKVVVLSASQPNFLVADIKEADKDKEKNSKNQRRKTIIFR